MFSYPSFPRKHSLRTSLRARAWEEVRSQGNKSAGEEEKRKEGSSSR